MQIMIKPLKELIPAPYNPRVDLEPGDPHYRKLRRSIQRFGLVEPLLWNRRTGYLVGGHQRLRILHDLQYEEAPVSVIDLEPAAEMALNVLLNNKEAQGDWDLPRLTKVLEELQSLPEPELTATGFDDGHLKTLQAQLAPSEESTEEEEKATHYEVMLRIPLERFPEVRRDLDGLINKYDLETHVLRK